MLKTILIATLLALATSKTCKKCMSYYYDYLNPSMTDDDLTAAGMGELVDANWNICSEVEDETCSAETDICGDGAFSLSIKREVDGEVSLVTGLGVSIKTCVGEGLTCADLLALGNSALASNENAKTWIARCAFAKCDSDGANCAALDVQTYDEPADPIPKTCKKCMSFDYSEMSPAMTAEELTAAGMGAEVGDGGYALCTDAIDETCESQDDICADGYVSLSASGEEDGEAFSFTDVRINMKSCIAPDMDCDDLYEDMMGELPDEENGKMWIAKCSFDKCDSDGANCEELDEQTFEEPSSAATMTTMTVAIIALIKLF